MGVGGESVLPGQVVQEGRNALLVEGQGADDIAPCRVSRGRRAFGRVHGAKLLAGGCNGGGCAPCQDEPKALRGQTAHILQSVAPAVLQLLPSGRGDDGGAV